MRDPLRFGSVALLCSLGSVACAGGAADAGDPARPPHDAGAAVDARCAPGSGAAGCPPELTDEALGLGEGEAVAPLRRGLGSMTARVPGREAVVEGVRLASHAVRVTVRDGFARTEVEEVFQNDTDRVLEGRYLFPVPSGASLSRLALWVGERLMEGEMVERGRAAAIFKGIVDDTVRPRDPALLEWVRGSEVSLKIFPIPAHGSRRVLLAYDEALPGGAEGRYVHPLSLGADRGTTIDEFSLRVTVSEGGRAVEGLETPGWETTRAVEGAAARVAFAQQRFVPPSDFVVTWRRPPTAAEARPVLGEPPEAAARAARGAGPAAPDAGSGEAPSAFFTLRLRAELPAGSAAPPRKAAPRVIAVDTSGSQGADTLLRARRVVAAVLRSLEPSERFLVLACDTACVPHASALEARSPAAVVGAMRFLEQTPPAGASDVAGALVEAARRLSGEPGGQLVYVGDGAPTAGPLDVDAIAAQVRPHLDAARLDVRLFGVGRTLDEVVLGGLARALGGTYRRVATAGALAERPEDLAAELTRPVLRAPTLELPAGFTAVLPATLPNLVLGEEVLVHGRVAPGSGGEVRLRADLAGHAIVTTSPLAPPSDERNPIVPRLWAEARLAALAGVDDAASRREAIRLSRDHHVMSRHTALLVLETDRMFAEFGIERRRGAVEVVEGLPPGGGGGASLAPGSGGGGSSGPAGLVSRLDRLEVGTNGAMSPSGGSGVGLAGVGSAGASLGRMSPEPVRVRGMARVDIAQTSGSAPQNAGRVVAGMRGAFRACYQRALAQDPTITGTLVLELTVGAGGEVADAAVIQSPHPILAACTRGRARAARFEPPASAAPVRLRLRVVLTSQPAPPDPPSFSAPWIAPPLTTTATHADADDDWRSRGEDALAKVRAAVDTKPGSRAAHEALVRALLTRGRFEDAGRAAARFVELDPDLGLAHELAGWAAAARGARDAALAAVAALVEREPRSARAQVRAARAYDAAGELARACAHWTALATLRADDEARREALRCRATLGADAPGVLAEARAVVRPGPLVAALVTALEKGEPLAPLADRGHAGELEASVECAQATGCPLVVILTPTGAVASPWTPQGARATARSVAVALPRSGVYRTLLVGGEAGREVKVTVRAPGATRARTVTTGGVVSVLATTVQVPAGGIGCWGLGCLGVGTGRMAPLDVLGRSGPSAVPPSRAGG